MEFLGFASSDFDFFKKKAVMSKTEYDEKKEEVKRHFREFCYQIQKSYHTVTGKTLAIDKDFQGLNKNKNSITAKVVMDTNKYFSLNIVFSQDSVAINLACPPDDDNNKFQEFKTIVTEKKETFIKFFKENKSFFMILCKRNYKKPSDTTWDEEFKFNNNELCYGDYKVLLDNMDKLQPLPLDNKKLAGVHIGTQFGKTDAIKIGKQLASRVCSEIIKLLDLCTALL